jgi:hypothetical protein
MALKFEPTDRFEISGRGTVYTGACPIDIPDPAAWQGEPIEIDGVEYEIRDIERPSSLRGVRKGEPVRILVSGRKGEGR